MQTAPLLLLGGQGTEQRQRFLSPPAERCQRLAGVVPQVLSVLGEAVGCRRVGVDLRVVVGQDRVEANEVHLFDVPKVTDDLVGRPVLAVGPAREGGLALAADRGGEVVGGAGHAPEALLWWLLGNFFQRRHPSPSWHPRPPPRPSSLARAANVHDNLRRLSEAMSPSGSSCCYAPVPPSAIRLTPTASSSLPRPLEPEPTVHVMAVHRHGGGEMVTGLLALAVRE